MKDESTIVVGGGTVGLVTALGLAQAGVRVRVLEAEMDYVEAPRDIYYDWSTLPGLANLGVLPSCVSAGVVSNRWSYEVVETSERISFDLSPIADESKSPFNIHLGHHDMNNILLSALKKCDEAVVEQGAQVTHVDQDADGVTVVAEGIDGIRTYRSGWLVGADGSHSVVRRGLGLGFSGMTWPERLVSVNLRFDFSQLGFDSAGYRLDPRLGALVAKVDKSGLWRFLFAENRILREETVLERAIEVLARSLPVGADPLIESASPYRIHQRSAERFRVGRIMLVGDAAHLTNPTTGMGITSGLFDAYALTEALIAVARGECDDGILTRYSNVRHRNFWGFTSPTSSEAKELVFSPGSSSDLEMKLAELRQISDDPIALREYVSVGAGCATPSLLVDEESATRP